MPTPQIIVTPDASTEQLAEAVLEIQRILTGRLGLGDPINGQSYGRRTTPAPTRPAYTLGASDNVLGSFVEVTVEVPGDLNSNLEVAHNLNLPAPASRVGRNQRLNVRWLVAGIRYNNDDYANLTGVGNAFSVVYANGAVTENTIELRFYTSVAHSVGNPEIVFTLFFLPASQ